MDSSNVKHKPKTPLPFIDDGLCQVCVEGDATPVASVNRSGNGGEQDTAYFVHSANAYPKLVEALAGLTNNLWGTRVIEEGENAVICHRFVAARNLLRELGEL